MKFILSVSLIFLLFNTPSNAESSGIFDLGNNSQACAFVAEAEQIAEIDESARISCGTRTLKRFNEVGLLREAYRADPEATLDLIERILKAGKNN